MLKATIFDMDGLLINSEPLWHKAEKIVFKTVGIDLTTEQCLETTGFRVDDVVEYRHQLQPWSNKSKKEVEESIIEEVIHLVKKEGALMPGVLQTLELFKEKNIPMAVASSSSMRIILAALTALDLKGYFVKLNSAETETFAKPHPAVYLTAATKLGVSPMKCLAFEDSLTGTIAAKAARMKTISVPEVYTKKFEVADLVLESLTQFSEDHITQLFS